MAMSRPVSYTHLDVYKRQDEVCIKADGIDLNDPSQSRLLIGSMLCNDSKITDGVETVSYTHLDVYKRQS